MRGLTRDQARRQFFLCLGLAVPGLFSLGISLAIRNWGGALFAVALLLLISSWLNGLYAVGWPDSQPRFPFRFCAHFSNRQRALVELGVGLFLVVAVVVPQPNTFGFACGAAILVGTLFGFAATLKGKGWLAKYGEDK